MSASLRCRHHGDGQQYPWRCASMSAPSARPPFVSHAHLLLLNLLAGARILGPDRDPGGRVALIHLVARVIAVNLGFDVSPTSGHRRRSSASSLGAGCQTWCKWLDFRALYRGREIDRAGTPKRGAGNPSNSPVACRSSVATRLINEPRGAIDPGWQPGGGHAKHIDRDLADEIVRTKPMAGDPQAGVRTGGAAQISSPVKLWKPVIT
jgi:hypothetical protein